MNRQGGQRGATLTEFVVIAPLIVLITLFGIQIGLLQQARLCLDYAAFEAARAGARQHAGTEAVRDAWLRGMTPLLSLSGILRGSSYPRDPRLAARALRLAASAAEAPYFRIEILSPTREAFQDFADPALQRRLHVVGARVIPNDDLENRPPTPGAHSRVSIQQANVLRLRITYGYLPRVPLVGGWFTQGMSLLGGGEDDFKSALLADGRIPVVVETSTPMLGPAIENEWMAGVVATFPEPDPPFDPSDDAVDPPPYNDSAETLPGGAGDHAGDSAGAGGAEDDFCTDGEVAT